MFWKSKGNWKKPTKAGKSNEKPKRKTNEVMQAPVKPSLGVGKERKVLIKEDAPKPAAAKPVDPMPKSEPVEEKIEEVEIVEGAEEAEEEKSEPEVIAVDMNLSRKKLSEIAKSKGISVSKRMSKQDIIDAILEN